MPQKKPEKIMRCQRAIELFGTAYTASTQKQKYMGQTLGLLRRKRGRHRNEALIYLHITPPCVYGLCVAQAGKVLVLSDP